MDEISQRGIGVAHVRIKARVMPKRRVRADRAKRVQLVVAAEPQASASYVMKASLRSGNTVRDLLLTRVSR